MTNQSWTTEEPDYSITAEQAEHQPARGHRLRPAVRFGLRVAALAGLAVPAGAAAADLTGLFDDPIVVANPTTCCWPSSME